MKVKILIILIFLLTCSLFLFSACTNGCAPVNPGNPGETTEDETFVYVLQEDGTYAISKIKDSTLTEITLPVKFNNKDITLYAEDLFKSNVLLTDIYFSGNISDWCKIRFGNEKANPMHLKQNLYFNGELPDGNITIEDVSDINDYAFFNYNRIVNLELKEGVENIGKKAFEGCNNLMTITLPASLKTVGFSAFSDDKTIVSIYFNGTLSDWFNLSIGENASPMRYSSNFYIGGKLIEGELIVPSDVTEIGEYSFEYNNKITSVVIQHGVRSIGNSAFNYMENLRSVYIPASVIEIDYHVFSDEGGLKITCEADRKPHMWYDENDGKWYYGDVNIEWGYNNIKTHSLYNYAADEDEIYLTKYKGSETDIVVPEYIDNKKVVSVGDIFEENKTIKTAVIPDTVTEIWPYAFYNCTKLTEITTGEGATEIGINAFNNCARLNIVNLGSGIKRIGEDAFGYYNNLKRLNYSGDLESWCDIVYENNRACPRKQTDGLNDDYYTEIYIGGKRLEGEIVLPDGITEIKDYTFYRCHDITKVIFPSSVKTIGEYAFSSCEALTTVDWKYGIENIGKYAFYGCVNLEAHEFYESTVSIGRYAFANCKGLKTLTLPSSLKTIERYAFAAIEVEDLVLTEGLETIERYAFSQSKIKSLTLPESLKNIEIYSFEDCYDLETVIAPANITLTDDTFVYSNEITFYCYAESLPSTWHLGSKHTVILNFRAFGANDDYEYTEFNDNTVILTKYKGNYENVVMPDTINGNTVVDFGTIFAFYGGSDYSLKSIKISDYVTTVHKDSFYGREGIENIIFGKSVTTIETEIINFPVHLKYVIIPESVKNIENDFISPHRIIKILYEGSVRPEGWVFETIYPTSIIYNFKSVHQDDTYLYAVLKDNTVTILDMLNPTETVVLPDTLNNLPVRSFDLTFGQNNVTKYITIPESITNIIPGALSSCYNLQALYFTDPDGWRISETEDFSSSQEVLSASLKNPEGAVILFQYNYYDYYWKKTN